MWIYDRNAFYEEKAKLKNVLPADIAEALDKTGWLRLLYLHSLHDSSLESLKYDETNGTISMNVDCFTFPHVSRYEKNVNVLIRGVTKVTGTLIEVYKIDPEICLTFSDAFHQYVDGHYHFDFSLEDFSGYSENNDALGKLGGYWLEFDFEDIVFTSLTNGINSLNSTEYDIVNEFRVLRIPTIFKTDKTDFMLFVEEVDFAVCDILLSGKAITQKDFTFIVSDRNNGHCPCYEEYLAVKDSFCVDDYSKYYCEKLIEVMTIFINHFNNN
jgi:hypothetical protein